MRNWFWISRRAVGALLAMAAAVILATGPARSDGGPRPETAAPAAQCDAPAVITAALSLAALNPEPRQMSQRTYDLAWGRCAGQNKECHGGCIPPYAACCRGGGWCQASSGGCCGGGCCPAGTYCALVNGSERCYRRY